MTTKTKGDQDEENTANKKLLKMNLQEDKVKVLKEPPLTTSHYKNHLRSVW